MRVKLMTLRYSATLGGFDDTPLVDFTRDKEVIAFREHFYCVNEVPHISCIVHYQDAVVPRSVQQAAREIPARVPTPPAGRPFPGSGSARARDGAPDPCEGLSAEERALFNHLREWRSGVAHADGVPPYLVLTNRQLVAIVRARPDSPTALGHIEGIGPGKLERYGAGILQRLHGAPAAPQGEVALPAEAASDSPSDSAPSPAASVAP
jgi:ATP-dependent DNA helicase RecQ